MKYQLWYHSSHIDHTLEAFVHSLAGDNIGNWVSLASARILGSKLKPLDMDEGTAQRLLDSYKSRLPSMSFVLIPTPLSGPRQLLIDFQPQETV